MEPEILAMVAECPNDWTPRLILGDWLEQCGDPRAEMIRLHHHLLNGHWGDPHAVARLLELTRQGIVAPCPRLTVSQWCELVLLPPGSFVAGSPNQELGRR